MFVFSNLLTVSKPKTVSGLIEGVRFFNRWQFRNRKQSEWSTRGFGSDRVILPSLTVATLLGYLPRQQHDLSTQRRGDRASTSEDSPTERAGRGVLSGSYPPPGGCSSSSLPWGSSSSRYSSSCASRARIMTKKRDRDRNKQKRDGDFVTEVKDAEYYQRLLETERMVIEVGGRGERGVLKTPRNRKNGDRGRRARGKRGP